MLVVCVLSLKGGVGKTTITLGLASAALHRGLPTLVVDLDPQMNATTALDPPPTGATIADVLAEPRRRKLRAAIAFSAWGEPLTVLPGSEDNELHNHPSPDTKHVVRLAEALAKVVPQPELVLIDCPPSLGALTRRALAAADRALLVTEPSLFAVTGVQRALAAVQLARAEHPNLQPLGVVINRYRPRVTEHDYRVAELRDLFGPLVLNPVLPDRTALQQAQGAATAIHQWPSPGAREVAGLFDQLLERVLRSRRTATRTS